ncbi:Uncharacterized mitochondrial protein AtMg00860 [Striga hermonthica]|uniref:Uncharacterized mitochondrial protein AtMg00860 n=1 Tax=Striga hermonthica TaxID=68872 RepID=A0A9N7RGX8_STRHE|nr:Uncharacterized mitochondrial protein AtMg00860 [Striga hermonthica]
MEVQRAGNGKEVLKPILEEYQDIFQEPKGLPPKREIEHHITLKADSLPKQQYHYRVSHDQKNTIEEIVQEMLKSGIIQNNKSPFAAPVLLVKKKDLTWRLCVDYRYLNSLTIKHEFPIPVIEELLDELQGSSCFSKIDLRSCYFQILMKEEHRPLTAFTTHSGHYEFLVMPFGLCNAPATFQSLMNQVFQNCLRKFVLVFFYDILIYSKSWEEHCEHLRIVLQLLRDNTLYAKQSKCQFGDPTVEYLGHIISAEGVSTDPKKIQSMLLWPTPTTVKKLRGFLGLTGYYRRFIKGYGEISKPLTLLLRKNQFHWGKEADEAFSRLKKAMTSAPVLSLPNFSKPFIVETDASGYGIGAVLMQEGNNEEMIKEFKEDMMKTFKMTDVGQMSYFLGIEITSIQSTIASILLATSPSLATTSPSHPSLNKPESFILIYRLMRLFFDWGLVVFQSSHTQESPEKPLP